MHTYIHSFIHKNRSIHTCIYILNLTYIHIYLPTYKETDILTFIHAYICIDRYIKSCSNTSLYPHQYTYLHTQIHTYMHTFIYIYILTVNFECKHQSKPNT